MRKRMKNAARATLQDLVDIGVDTKFTKKELNELGVKVPEIRMTPSRIKRLRKKLSLSQAVFAKILNVSLSSVRQWEIGVRNPNGSAKVLLEILERDEHALDFRINRNDA